MSATALRNLSRDFVVQHGRILYSGSPFTGTYYAVGPHVWFVLSATQHNYSGEYCHDYTNRFRSAIDDANANGRRIFYDEYSDTIRQAPQNYCLAVRGTDGGFVPQIDNASTINAHSLALALAQCADAITEQELGRKLSAAFYG